MAYTREELQTLPRAKLQSICKGIGFKANESTSKIIENILSYEAEQAAHRLRSTKSIGSVSIPELTTRRVTRGSELPKKHEQPEPKSVRRSSSRLTSNPLKSIGNSTQTRKSKATQISLGVGRPKAVGGSGARIITRSSTASGKSRRGSSKGKQRIMEQGILEEDESGEGLSPDHVESHEAGTIMITGLPPTPAATPNNASGNSENEAIQVPTTANFAPFHKLQTEMAELSSHYCSMKEQIKQITSLQQEVSELKILVERQAAESIQKENETISQLRSEMASLRAEIVTLQQIVKQAGMQESTAGQQPQSTDLQAPGPTIQVLGKRLREQVATPKGVLDQAGSPASPAASLSFYRPPTKRARLVQEEDCEQQANVERSPFRLSSLDEHTLAEKLPNNAFDFASIFNLTAAAELPVETQETMLGVPPPGVSPHFLNEPTTSLPFALTATGPKPPEGSAPSRARREDQSHNMRKESGNRLNPYKRPPSRFRTPSHDADLFNFFGSSELLGSRLQGPADDPEQPQPAVGVNPAQLLAQDISEGNRSPPAARTLYGTELEGDTRFGEFGIDGLSRTFWKAPGFPC